jgi:putative hydrolase of HD superfamily
MALTHDLCEALAGDVTPLCNVTAEEKHQREDEAMQKIRDQVGGTVGQELYDYWLEYEHQESLESHYVKDIDKFEMVTQVKGY